MQELSLTKQFVGAPTGKIVSGGQIIGEGLIIEHMGRHAVLTNDQKTNSPILIMPNHLSNYQIVIDEK